MLRNTALLLPAERWSDRHMPVLAREPQRNSDAPGPHHTNPNPSAFSANVSVTLMRRLLRSNNCPGVRLGHRKTFGTTAGRRSPPIVRLRGEKNNNTRFRIYSDVITSRSNIVRARCTCRYAFADRLPKHLDRKNIDYVCRVSNAYVSQFVFVTARRAITQS